MERSCGSKSTAPGEGPRSRGSGGVGDVGENVEALRCFFQTWEPWEWARGENMSLFDPDLVYEGDVLPDHVGESYRGHEGLARATRQWLEPFDDGSTVELERIIGTGDDLVSVQRGRGRMWHT